MEIDTKFLYDDFIEEITNDEEKFDDVVEPLEKDNLKLLKIDEDDDDFIFDEEELFYDYEDRWSYVIRERGEDYYFNNNVLNVYKNKNKYVAKVKGNSSKLYDVTLEVTKDDLITSCTCPCTYPCKHEYAVLMAISYGEYKNIKLKQTIKEKEINIESIINDIPSEELKTYILTCVDKDKINFEIESFTEYFIKYLPVQDYEYYYNNLYNSLVLDTNYKEQIAIYLNMIKQYISTGEFKEVIKITKAIVEAYKDSNKMNFNDYFIDILPSVGMFLRVTYRKSNELVKQEIIMWINELEKENYYNNYYLEDVVLSLK